MDVTPTPKMFEAMQKFTDAIVGEAPMDIEKSAAAEQRRAARQYSMDFMHRLVHLAMREGAARAWNPNRTELGRVEESRRG
jgi:alpha-D-ribose 1-methylphosphonate 5-triphosphate diphosphatase PhnM